MGKVGLVETITAPVPDPIFMTRTNDIILLDVHINIAEKTISPDVATAKSVLTPFIVKRNVTEEDKFPAS